MQRQRGKHKAGASLALIEAVCLTLALAAIAAGAVQERNNARPSATEQEAFLSAARQVVMSNARRLPDFLCTETVERSVIQDGFPGGRFNTLTVEVGYSEGTESYRLTKINGRAADKAYGDLDGAYSRGEFGSNLRTIFDPSSQARFRFERWTTAGG